MTSFSQRWRFDPYRPEGAPPRVTESRPAGDALNEARRLAARERGVPAVRRVVDTDSWRDLAACHGCDPELMFPGKGDASAVAAAKAVCAGCPVRAECLAWAVSNPGEQGVLGGMTASERRRVRRERKVEVA